MNCLFSYFKSFGNIEDVFLPSKKKVLYCYSSLPSRCDELILAFQKTAYVSFQDEETVASVLRIKVSKCTNIGDEFVLL